MTPWSPLAIVSVEVPSSSVISTVVFPAPSVPTVPIVTEFPVLDFAIVYVWSIVNALPVGEIDAGIVALKIAVPKSALMLFTLYTPVPELIDTSTPVSLCTA